MKILFITDNFPPEVNAPATRTFEHCKEWVKKGHEVTILTCFPNFPQGKVYDGYKNKLYQKEIIDGIKVIRVWSYIVSNKGFIKRTLDYLSFSFMSFWFGIFRKTDVIVATSPQFFTTWSARFLSFFKRKPWVFELRDLWPESIKTVGAMEEGRLYKILERIELSLYKSADLIVPVTEAFKTNLMKRGINGEKQLVITNGANLELYKRIPPDEKLLEELNLKNKYIIGYIGTLGMAHNLDFILKCATKISDDSIHFLFIGDGAEKESLLEQAEKLQLKNVTFLRSVPKEEVKRYLSIVNLSLIPLKKSDTFKTVIPSKIFESSAMGKPILLGVEGQAKEIIKSYNAGICFEPENKIDFIRKLELIKNNKELYKQITINQLTLAKDFDRKILADRMLSGLQKLVESNRKSK